MHCVIKSKYIQDKGAYVASMMFGVEAPRFASLLTEEVGTDKDRAKIVSFQRLCLLNRDLLIPYYNDYAEKLDLTCKFDSGRASQPSMKKKID